MNIFTVSLFGHRIIEDPRLLDGRLAHIIKELIQTKQYISFLIGRSGEFDEYDASIIKRTQKQFGNENSEITLVLPYTTANMEFYEKYYDDIIISENVHGTHPKPAIAKKNRWMVEQSDLVILYAERENGGAYTAMKYAKKLNKNMINLCTNMDYFSCI